MEHILQFAIGIDDDAIAKNIQANAEREITKNLQQAVINQLIEKPYYGKPTLDGKFSAFGKEIITGFMEEHKDEIIARAADELAKRLARTKAAKEAIT